MKKKKTTRGHGPYLTTIKSILSFGQKDVKMARKEIESLNYEELFKLICYLAIKLAYYYGIALIAVKIIGNLAKLMP